MVSLRRGDNNKSGDISSQRQLTARNLPFLMGLLLCRVPLVNNFPTSHQLAETAGWLLR